MIFKARREALILFVGDCVVFAVSLWLALFLRAAEIPSLETILLNVAPFSIIAVVWLLVFFIFDLYAKQTVVVKRGLPQLILRAQALNLFLSVIFFYFIPYFIVAPKTILFLDIGFVTILMYLWRRIIVEIVPRGRVESAVILSDKPEGGELEREIEGNSKYGIRILPPSVLETGNAHKVSFVILDLSNPSYSTAFKDFYSLLVTGVRFVDIADFYEDIFDRVPLSYVDEQWFLRHVSNRPKLVYDSAKRIFDIVLAGLLWILSLPFYLCVWVAIQLDDGGSVFFTQERVGRNGRVFTIHKFRSMHEGKEITRVGHFFRKTRIDELPQLTSIIRGDLALIGPRPEKPDYVALYRDQLPYYDARHMIAPGLSGWAQIYHENHPHFAPALEQTKEKLSYDLYYIKNRSFWLDIKIALKTIKTLFLTAGI